MFGQRDHPRCAAEERGALGRRHFVGRERDGANRLAASEPLDDVAISDTCGHAGMDRKGHCSAGGLPRQGFDGNGRRQKIHARIDEPGTCGVGDDVACRGAWRQLARKRLRLLLPLELLCGQIEVHSQSL